MLRELARNASKAKPFLLVLSSPSGGGKTTVCGRLLKRLPWLSRCVTATTRAPRKGEKHGRDYWFLSVDEFQARRKKGGFYEWARVHGNFYGTPKDELESALKRGRSQVLVIDVKGAAQVRKRNKAAVLVFLLPPSFQALERRLRGRGKDHHQEVARRMVEARRELVHARHYDYLVVNEVLAKAVDHVADIARAARWRQTT
jgi:guanylate kinase